MESESQEAINEVSAHHLLQGELIQGDTSVVNDQFDLNSLPEEAFDDDNQETEVNIESHHIQQHRLNNEERKNILLWLVDKKVSGFLPRGAINEASAHFGYTRKTISGLWNLAKQQSEASQAYNVDNNYHNCGRKRIAVPYNQITGVQMGKRTCLRDLAAVMLDVSHATVHRMVKRGIIRPHTNSLNPGMKESNKIKRVHWVISLLMRDTIETSPTYYSMYDFVHVDEKWFNLTQKCQRVYLAQDETRPYRSTNNKNKIPKVMFCGAVARPRWNSRGECIFPGKIGIFPFTYQEVAKRTSKYRVRGTLETKIIESVNQDVYRDMLINKIVPEIKEKWPSDGNPKTIFIQHDNAKAHITQQDAQWQQVHQQDGFTFILIQQPPNSPDCNILDLGFFRSIQSLMHKKMPGDVDKLIEVVEEAFYELHPKTLSNVWMSYQYVMNEIIKAKGSNDYDVPHVNKKRLEDEGNLPEKVKAPRWAVLEGLQLLNTEHEQVVHEQHPEPEEEQHDIDSD